MSPTLKCPHCKTKAKSRTSRDLSDITKEIYYQCQNVLCGHTWVANLSAVRTIVPSQTPKASVYIPLSERSELVAAGPPTG